MSDTAHVSDAVTDGTARAIAWNGACPIGTPVVADSGVETTTRSLAWNLVDGTPVVQLVGYADAVALSRMRRMADPDPWIPNGGHENSCGYVGGVTARCTCGGGSRG
ncbi:hypothetical protein ACIPW5_11155 [Streptomyces sp. NPDC090077]|uniref:hypothetical protein n=1 Tax=Streptomyces sp. NPDC090077 TaxID=3365938 RepID=UPI0037FC6928